MFSGLVSEHFEVPSGHSRVSGSGLVTYSNDLPPLSPQMTLPLILTISTAATGFISLWQKIPEERFFILSANP